MISWTCFGDISRSRRWMLCAWWRMKKLKARLNSADAMARPYDPVAPSGCRSDWERKSCQFLWPSFKPIQTIQTNQDSTDLCAQRNIKYPLAATMTTATPYRISGHEGFPCRYTWLPKAV